MWRHQAALVNWLPKQGDLINAYGSVSVYERGGVYQFYAEALEHGGLGLLWQEFARLRARLEAEGLFDPARKRHVPAYPQCIGVVTSPTGAALQDILKVLRHRYRPARVLVSPTPVQGMDAPARIAQAIERLNAQAEVDVMIVARGGGSIEDLMAFNDERVARAIALARVPVITGVGHETDVTIADLVADVWAPTPSVAATAAVPDGEALRCRIYEKLDDLQAIMHRRLSDNRSSLAQRERVLRTFQPQRVISEQRQRLDDRVTRLMTSMRHGIAMRRADLAVQTARLDSMDTRQVLDRGFALVELLSTGARVSSITQVSGSDEVLIHVRDGQATATVSQTHALNARGETRAQDNHRGENGHQGTTGTEF
jgi:exodeoxyribonuclease VII large subunit